jgi:hypothetical protein
MINSLDVDITFFFVAFDLLMELMGQTQVTGFLPSFSHHTATAFDQRKRYIFGMT